MQKANCYGHDDRCNSFVGVRFQVYFTPLPGFFSPFPRGTRSLSVTIEYLALEGGPPGFEQSFTCSVLLGIPRGQETISSKGLSPAMAGLSRPFLYRFIVPQCGPATPVSRLTGLGSCAFARHYLRNLG